MTAFEYLDDRGIYVEAAGVEERDGRFFSDGQEVVRRSGRMGKSRKNMVTPDEIYRDYGADTLRLYEMFMGPLDANRAWSTADIAGVYRFLQRFWRNVVDEDTGEPRISADVADDGTRRLLHRTIDAVRADMGTLEYNTAIARLFELNNHLTQVVARNGLAPAEVVHTMVLMIAPLTPHVAEELWEKSGHDRTITFEPFPEADGALLVDDEIEIPVQVNGKLRARVHVATGADDVTHEAAAPRRRAHRRAARRRDRPQGRRGAGSSRELRRRLTLPRHRGDW